MCPFPKDQLFLGSNPLKLVHSSLIAILHERISAADGHHVHYELYELYWQPDLGKAFMRVFGELYTLPEFICVHQKLQKSPPEPGCGLPHHVAGLIFFSDVTHLTQFGDAKLWPVYLFFGNDSKYWRCKPSLHLCNHIAYLHIVSCFFICHFIGFEAKVAIPSFQTISMTSPPITLERHPQHHSRHTVIDRCSINSGKPSWMMSL